MPGHPDPGIYVYMARPSDPLFLMVNINSAPFAVIISGEESLCLPLAAPKNG